MPSHTNTPSRTWFALSPDPLHRLSNAYKLKSTEDTTDATDPHSKQIMVNDINVELDNRSGWLLAGPDQKLLLWVPPVFRDQLSWPGTKYIIGAPSIHLDLSRLPHGKDWYKCFIGTSGKE